MLHLSEAKIKEIPQDLDVGFVCYINIRTGEHLTIPNDYDSFDTDSFDDVVAEVEKNEKLYLKIEPPMSRESFRIMNGFIDSLPSHAHRLKDQLAEALHNRKPFANFKNIVDHSGQYREKWFAYKSEQFIEYVKNHLRGDEEEDD